jgi:hypothetical protein
MTALLRVARHLDLEWAATGKRTRQCTHCDKRGTYRVPGGLDWACITHGAVGMESETGRPFVPRHRCIREDCGATRTTYHNANKTLWACRIHATKEMRDEKKTAAPTLELLASQDIKLYAVTNEDVLIGAVLRIPPDVTIVTPTGTVGAHFAVVSPYFKLEGKDCRVASFDVSYPEAIVRPVVLWMYKEDYLHLDAITYEQTTRMLNMVCNYSMPKLRALLRKRLADEYKGLTHAKLLVPCSDPVVKDFLHQKLANTRLELAKVARETKCLNSPRQTRGDDTLYLCCDCDAGRLSTGVSYGGALTCSHYTMLPAAATASETSARDVAAVKWCCLHGRPRSPDAELMADILKQLDASRRRDIAERMM